MFARWSVVNVSATVLFMAAAPLPVSSCLSAEPSVRSSAIDLVSVLSSGDPSPAASSLVRARLARMTPQQREILASRVPDDSGERDAWAAHWRERQLYPSWRTNWPVTVWMPSGASMSARGVISGDRRYVRTNAVPMFYGFGSRSGQIPGIEAASPAARSQPRVRYNGMRTVVE